jgi:hypothetical protein
VRAGRDFVGDRRDEQGIAIFQAFSTTNFSLGLSFERVRNNVANDPLQQTLTRQQARAFLSLKLSEILPTFRVFYRLQHARWPGAAAPYGSLTILLHSVLP